MDVSCTVDKHSTYDVVVKSGLLISTRTRTISSKRAVFTLYGWLVSYATIIYFKRSYQFRRQYELLLWRLENHMLGIID